MRHPMIVKANPEKRPALCPADGCRIHFKGRMDRGSFAGSVDGKVLGHHVQRPEQTL